jgi:hypothetical protein
MNEKLSEALGRAKEDTRLQKLLEETRAELKEVGRQVTSAPAYQASQPPPPQQQVQPISDAMLRSIVLSINSESSGSDKMAILTEAAVSHYFLVSQVQQLLTLFAFTSDRLQAMRLLGPRILDPNNGHRLYGFFDFSGDKEELKRILQQ